MKNPIKVIPTGIVISYKKNGNIRKCNSIFDNEDTNKPLSKESGLKHHSSYIPLMVGDINKWFNKFDKF